MMTGGTLLCRGCGERLVMGSVPDGEKKERLQKFLLKHTESCGQEEEEEPC